MKRTLVSCDDVTCSSSGKINSLNLKNGAIFYFVFRFCCPTRSGSYFWDRGYPHTHHDDHRLSAAEVNSLILCPCRSDRMSNYENFSLTACQQDLLKIFFICAVIKNNNNEEPNIINLGPYGNLIYWIMFIPRLINDMVKNRVF